MQEEVRRREMRGGVTSPQHYHVQPGGQNRPQVGRYVLCYTPFLLERENNINVFVCNAGSEGKDKNNFLWLWMHLKSKVRFLSISWRHLEGKKGIVPLILDIGTKWRWVVRFVPWLCHYQERTLVPIERKDRWVPEMVWTLWGIDKFLAPANSLVAMLTISWLPRSKMLNSISYYTSNVKSSHLNIVLVIFF